MTMTTIDVELGKTFEIKVESNPSTGYVWEPIYDAEFLDLLGEEFEKRSDRIGSSGTSEFSFIPLRMGRTHLTMQLRRPWETEAANRLEYDIEIL
jgi:predicted secreted protein